LSFHLRLGLPSGSFLQVGGKATLIAFRPLHLNPTRCHRANSLVVFVMYKNSSANGALNNFIEVFISASIRKIVPYSGLKLLSYIPIYIRSTLCLSSMPLTINNLADGRVSLRITESQISLRLLLTVMWSRIVKYIGTDVSKEHVSSFFVLK
jgi:hypothetical protein